MVGSSLLTRVFLVLLWNDVSYIIHSEPELEHRYADLCLLRRPDARTSSLWDLLFEFKRLSLKELGMTGKDVKAASRTELMKLALVSDVPAPQQMDVVSPTGLNCGLLHRQLLSGRRTFAPQRQRQLTVAGAWFGCGF